MKKTLLLLLVSMACLGATAQGLYVGIGGGYGFQAGKQTLSSNMDSYYYGTGTTTDYHSNPCSFGKGYQPGLYAGYMLNKNIGAELGVGYLIGGTVEFIHNSTYTSPAGTDRESRAYNATSIRLAPSIRITGGEKKIKPFMTFGLLMAMGTKITLDDEDTYTDASGTNRVVRVSEYSGRMSFGLHATAGISYSFTDHISAFVNAAGNFQNWAPKKQKLVEYTSNGVDQLPGLPVAATEMEFSDSYTIDLAAAPDPNKPVQSTKVLLPLSSIGVELGIHFNFGKTE